MDILDRMDANKHLPLASLIIVNLIPLFGVFFWDWDVGSLVVLYWSENLIIGAFTLGKMIAASPLGGVFSGAFFLIHYGGFCAVHGIFVLTLTTDMEPDILAGDHWPFFLIFVQMLVGVVQQVLAQAPAEWLLGFAALTISHAISLLVNYIGKGEYKEQTVRSLMTAPYKRIVVLHVAILFGGFGIMALGSPLPLLVLLVGLKIVLDMWLHKQEHQKQEHPPAS